MSITRTMFLAPLLFACQATTSMDTRVPTDLEDLVRVYQEGTGVNVTYDEATQARLAATPVRRVGGPDLNTIQIGSPAAEEEQVSHVQFEVLHLQHADARSLAQSLEVLLHDASQGRNTRVQVLADTRLNALLVRAPDASLARLKELVGHLDVEVGEG